jgi:glycosyltransferase involved in cell wall biosynthesis
MWEYYKPKFEYEDTMMDCEFPWAGHKFFAYDLIRNLNPSNIVELGTYAGTSLFSFLQAIKDGGFDSTFNAVDIWKGDEHSGYYDENVYNNVKAIVENHYSGVNIKLIRKKFDDALSDFSDKSIDLLHIDGLHTYEAVKHDFESWLPKVKDDGIILFHDISETKDDFGVFRLWDELKSKYGTVEFRHSHGLGVLFLDSNLFDKYKALNNVWQAYYYANAENAVLNFKNDVMMKENDNLRHAFDDIESQNRINKSIIELQSIKIKEIDRLVFYKFFSIVKLTIVVLKRDGIFSLLKKAANFIKKNIKSNSVLNRIVKKKNNFIKKRGMISVIIPIYNRTDELRESIDSILMQTYENFEILLVTDGSPVETINVVEEYRNNSKIKIFHYYNNTGNAVRGRNKGIKEASGEYIAFQDSDDIAEHDRLEKSIQYINGYDVDIVYGGWRAKIDGTRIISDLTNGQEVMSPDCDLNMLKDICVPCQSTVMVRKEALLSVGGLKNKMKYREDHELWIRLAYFGYKFKAIPNVLTNLRLHAGNNELNFKEDDHKWKSLMLSEYKIKTSLPLKIGFVVSGVDISGGIMVILNHANKLLELGYDVSIINQDNKTEIDWFLNQRVTVIPIKDIANEKMGYQFENIDILFATHWLTVDNVLNIKSARKIYFVQSDERNFENSVEYKKSVQETYCNKGRGLEFVTMAHWIQKWLKSEFGHDSYYVPNGLDTNIFHPTEPIAPKGKKLRVLLEGPIDIPFKGMADAFNAVKDLDCEVWAISSAGKPKPEWRCDRFFEKVPMMDMAKIYSSCDILLKMSKVESFCYPPLEMMACGGIPVILNVAGIEEYAVNNVNCIIIDNIKDAGVVLQDIILDKDKLNVLRTSALETAKNFNWDNSVNELEKIIKNENKIIGIAK